MYLPERVKKNMVPNLFIGSALFNAMAVSTILLQPASTGAIGIMLLTAAINTIAAIDWM